MTEDDKEYFKRLSDDELITAFNREVGNLGWTSSRASYLAALHRELQNRQFDYSIIGNKNYLSFARKIRLMGKKIFIEN